MRNQDALVWQIDLVHVAHDDLNATEQLPQRIYDVGDFEIAGRDLVKHRRKEKEVVAADQANLGLLSRQHRGQQFLQAHRGVNATETAAEDQNAFFSGLQGRRPVMVSFEGAAGGATADKRMGTNGEVSSSASRIPSEALWVAFLNSLIPWPRLLASSGSFLAPKRISTIARIRMISPPPRLKMANIGFSCIPIFFDFAFRATPKSFGTASIHTEHVV